MTSDPQYAASLDADINSERDTWTIVNSFNNHGQLSDERLLAALQHNREKKSEFQDRYARLVHESGGIAQPASRERRACFKELNERFSTIELHKTSLRQRGVDFPFDHEDEEHPNAAYKRILRGWEKQWEAEARSREKENRSDCYVVCALYGFNSAEAERARKVCKWRFAANPLVMPSWVLYGVVGEYIGLQTLRRASVARVTSRLIARPIIAASNERLASALPWVVYLALPGWIVVGGIYFAFSGLSGG